MEAWCRERLHLPFPQGDEGRTLTCLVGFVDLTQREPVVDVPRDRPRATVHDSQGTPRKCQDYCEREVDELKLQGDRVYLHLGARRDEPPRR